MANALTDLLEARDWLLLDGAVGTNLFAMGLAAGEAPEFWNIDAPDRIRALHNEFIEAGSDLILTNSFGGSTFRLGLHNAQDRVFELNRAAAGIARECAGKAGRKVIVAGSLGPTGEILQPVGALSHVDAVAAFEDQIRGLVDGGVDIVWAETISSAEELRAAAEAAANLDAPFCATLSFDTAGCTMMGMAPADYAAISKTLATEPLAIGANCGTGAPDLLRAVRGIVKASPEAAVIAKANAGVPKYIDGRIHYDGTPDLMADYARLARDLGARLIGGCCGTGPEHLRAMRMALEAHVPGPAPSLESVSKRVGAFSMESAGTTRMGASESGRGRPRRRR